MFATAWIRQLRTQWLGLSSRKRGRKAAALRRRVRPWLEALEERLVPTTTTYTVAAGDVKALIADIKAANSNGAASNTINLAANSTYNLTSVNNNWYGPNALPAITGNLTINGHGDTLKISGKNMRFFYVSGGPTYTGGALHQGTLELDYLTLTGGVAQGGNGGSGAGGGGGGLGAGGAIFNQGNLTLNGDTLTNNQVQGGNGGSFSTLNPGSGGGGMSSSGGGGGRGNNGARGGGFGGGFSIANGPKGGSGGGGKGGGGAGFQKTDDGSSGANGGKGGGKGGFGGGGGDGGEGGGGYAAIGSGNGGGFGGGGAGGVYRNNKNEVGGGGGGGGSIGGGGGGAGFAGPEYGSNGGSGGFGGGGGSGSYGRSGGDGGSGGFGGGGGAGASGGTEGVNGGQGGPAGFGGGKAGYGVSNGPNGPGNGGGGGVGGGGGAGGGFGGGGGAGGDRSMRVGGPGGFGGGFGGAVGRGATIGGGGGGMGGGIFNMFGSLTITNSTLSGNTAQGGNGVNSFKGSGVGSGYGGALFNLDGNATLTYVTIANNNALQGTGGREGNADGSGVYNLAYGNTITQGGANTAALTLNNSVIGQNSGGNNLVNDSENGKNTNLALVEGSSSVVQGGASQIGNGLKTTLSGAISVTSAPNLATTLANNGGLTETLAPLSGSPVLGAGNAYLAGLPSVDQRGLGRPSATSNLKPDDGAFQTQTTTTTVRDVTTTYTGAGQKITLTAAVDAFNDPNQPVTQGKVTFTIPKLKLSSLPATVNNDGKSPGLATTTIPLPGRVSLGKYTITAAYSDPNTPALYEPSHGTGTLTVRSFFGSGGAAPPTSGGAAAPTSPVGSLTPFAFGWVPTGPDLFEVDSQGDVFAEGLFGGGLQLVNTSVQLPLDLMTNDALLALLAGDNGQDYVLDVFDPWLPLIESEVLAALVHL